jgi:hypothetical protein
VSILRLSAFALVCVSLLMQHPASAKTANFVYYTIQVPDDWTQVPSKPTIMWSGDRSTQIVAGNAVMVGPSRWGNEDPSQRREAVEQLLERIKALTQATLATMPVAPISDLNTKEFDGHRLLVNRTYRVDPWTMYIIYYVTGPYYVATFSVTTTGSIDAANAVMERICTSLNWVRK